MPRFYTYHIRIGNSTWDAQVELGLDHIADWCRLNFTKIFSVLEHGSLNEGRHMHMILVTYDVKEQTVRKRLLKRWPTLKGRGKYSIKELATDGDIDRCTTYLCKGDNATQMPRVLSNNMLTQENIIERFNKYWSQSNTIPAISDDKIIVPMPVVPKKTKPTAVQAIAEILQCNNEGHDWMMNEDDMQMVYGATMRYLGRKGKTLDVIIVRRICLGVLNILAHDDLSNELWRRLFPEFIK